MSAVTAAPTSVTIAIGDRSDQSAGSASSIAGFALLAHLVHVRFHAVFDAAFAGLHVWTEFFQVAAAGLANCGNFKNNFHWQDLDNPIKCFIAQSLIRPSPGFTPAQSSWMSATQAGRVPGSCAIACRSQSGED